VNRESRNRLQALPEGLGVWDRFWYFVLYLLGVVQELIILLCIKEHCWRSQNGKVRTLRQMDDRHLGNSIRMLERTGDSGQQLTHLYAEQFRRAQETA
jgi:hypothetical protein